MPPPATTSASQSPRLRRSNNPTLDDISLTDLCQQFTRLRSSPAGTATCFSCSTRSPSSSSQRSPSPWRPHTTAASSLQVFGPVPLPRSYADPAGRTVVPIVPIVPVANLLPSTDQALHHLQHDFDTGTSRSSSLPATPNLPCTFSTQSPSPSCPLQKLNKSFEFMSMSLDEERERKDINNQQSSSVCRLHNRLPQATSAADLNAAIQVQRSPDNPHQREGSPLLRVRDSHRLRHRRIAMEERNERSSLRARSDQLLARAAGTYGR